jgi:hypothetical protein
MIARARLMMALSAVTTLIAAAAVFSIIGYRIFGNGETGTASVADAAVALPKGAHIMAMSGSGGRLALLLDNAGATELRVFDLKTLKPVGRLRFTAEP